MEIESNGRTHRGAAKQSGREEGLATEQEASFGHLLLLCARLYDQLGQTRLNATVREELARPAVMRLVPFVTREGIRPTELARRTDVTKQAVSQTLAQLERRGLVEFTPDPQDGRALLVRMTDDGLAMARRGLDALEEVRQEIEARVGRDVVQQTFSGLSAIVAVLQEMTRGDH
jgi:DNA-binding MarR family transcriptional regulator